jgi:hypothetical protein
VQPSQASQELQRFAKPRQAPMLSEHTKQFAIQKTQILQIKMKTEVEFQFCDYDDDTLILLYQMR